MISWGPASEQKCMHVANHIVYNMYSCGNFYSRDHGRCRCVKRHVKSNELRYSSQHEAQLGLSTGRAFGRLRCPAAHTWSQGGGFSGNNPWPRNWYASREPTQGGSGLAGIMDVTVRWLLRASQLTTVPTEAPPARLRPAPIPTTILAVVPCRIHRLLQSPISLTHFRMCCNFTNESHRQ